MAQNGTMKTSFLIQRRQVNIRWDIPAGKKHTHGRTVGADQGVLTCLTLSDGQVTKTDNHGFDLNSIMDRLNRRRKGSKGFKKAQTQRLHYINHSINQLNFNGIKEIRLEKIKNLRRGMRTSKKLGHFTYTQIREKIIDVCQRTGVQFVEQGNVYMSQRCSSCEYVHKASRKRKLFVCKNCSFTMDADLNAALNHESDIMELPYGFWRHKLNRIGFFWTINGLFDNDGQVLTVPDIKY